MKTRTPRETAGGDCAVPDENLLMYLHGALPPMARFRAGRHVRGCPTCRRRLAAFAATSQALADTIRGGALPRWTPPTLPAPRVLPATPFAVLFLGLSLIWLTVSVWTNAGRAGIVLPGSAFAATAPASVSSSDDSTTHCGMGEVMPPAAPARNATASAAKPGAGGAASAISPRSAVVRCP
jgi:anti-sigma factor RsiW